MPRALFLSLALLSLGCGAGEPADPATPAAPGPRAAPDPALEDPPTSAEQSPPEALGGTDPYGNSVADDDLRPEACAGSGERHGGACTANSDCGICHDGSNCGRPASREEITRLGMACRQEDAAQCEYAVVRCCEGHCKVTGY